MDKMYMVAEVRVEVINMYGLYTSPDSALAKAQRMSEDSGHLNNWVVFEYDGFNKWTATELRARRAGT